MGQLDGLGATNLTATIGPGLRCTSHQTIDKPSQRAHSGLRGGQMMKRQIQKDFLNLERIRLGYRSPRYDKRYQHHQNAISVENPQPNPSGHGIPVDKFP